MKNERALEIQKEVFKSFKKRNNEEDKFDPNLPTFWAIHELDILGYIQDPPHKKGE